MVRWKRTGLSLVLFQAQRLESDHRQMQITATFGNYQAPKIPAPVTACCVWVRGHVKFQSDYVARWVSMVSRVFEGRPLTMVCLTDRPEALGQIEGLNLVKIPFPTPRTHGRRKHGWWSKLQLFNPAHRDFVKGRCIYFDLDTIILPSAAEIPDFEADFALAPCGASGFKPLAFKTVSEYNSSVMVWNAGEQDDLYKNCDHRIVETYWGDQDWIAKLKPGQMTMPLAWFPRISELKTELPGREARVVLCKYPKNVEAAKIYPWVAETWR
jgi:hypothetical protein